MCVLIRVADKKPLALELRVSAPRSTLCLCVRACVAAVVWNVREWRDRLFADARRRTHAPRETGHCVGVELRLFVQYVHDAMADEPFSFCVLYLDFHVFGFACADSEDGPCLYVCSARFETALGVYKGVCAMCGA